MALVLFTLSSLCAFVIFVDTFYALTPIGSKLEKWHPLLWAGTLGFLFIAMIVTLVCV
jgi:hypothetical protein